MQPLTELIARKPAYDGGSIVNLIASLQRAAGGEPAYPELLGLDSAQLANARHLVLLVVDGLGDELLRSVPAAESLRSGLAASITSVYPPTTATAVTAFLTGLAPQQHGLTGWFMHFPSLGSVVTVLPFTTRLGGHALGTAGVDPVALLGHTPVFDTMRRQGFSVAPHDIAHSPFNRAHSGRAEIKPYKTIDELFAALGRIVRLPVPTFTYAYWPWVDRLAHEHGPSSAAVHAHIAELDRRYGEFLAAAAGSGTAIFTTADHGFIDVASDKVVDLAAHPELKRMLLLPLCGEPRTAYCYVAPGRNAAFDDYARSELGEAVLCVPSEALLDEGYFGLGTPHPELRARIGHFTLLARGGYVLVDRVPGEKPFTLLGVHGGGSTAEIDVPLIRHFI